MIDYQRLRAERHIHPSHYQTHESTRLGLPALYSKCIQLLIAALVCLCTLLAGIPQAQAAPTFPVVPVSPAFSAADQHKNGRHGKEDASVKLSIRSATPVVSSSSGYTVKLAVTNTANEASGPGSLSVDTNALYTFSSRIDMQDWAEGNAHIPTPNHLATQAVGSIEPGQSVEVIANTPADNDQLKAMITWGPKPLLLTYQADQQTASGKHLQGTATTFLTRSSDGLTTAQTPPMSLTMLLPLTSSGWSLDQSQVKQLMTGKQGESSKSKEGGKDDEQSASPDTPSSSQTSGHTSAEDSKNGNDNDANKHSTGSYSGSQSTSSGGAAATDNTHAGTAPAASGQQQPSIVLSQQARETQSNQLQLIGHHSRLNTLVDPLYLAQFESTPRVDAGMQPAAFDLSAYNSQSAGRYSAAGVELKDWNAQQASSELASSLHATEGDKAKPLYAWQGQQAWSLSSLAQARQQGYTAVVAPRGLAADNGSSAHTSKFTVPTDAGDITVLSAQQELSTLAQGDPTSAKAGSEQTTAGQVARFIAQSAFYQMEQPYAQRAILVCFDSDQDTEAASRLMDALEQAPWLNLSDLNTLAQAEPYTQGEDAKQLVTESDKSTGASASLAAGLGGTLDSLAASRSDIQRFADTMLTAKAQTPSSSASSSGRSDAQALARQDATDTARRSDDPRQWLERVTQIHDDLALYALACTSRAASLADSARAVSDQLLNGVQIKPSESVTVVSETAKMPVTISNSHPYPVSVKVSAKTDSMEIVTTRLVDALIPANSETQVTFTIRVATAGQADAEIALVDQHGQAFGQTRTTHITSNLRLSDMSGLLIVVFALVFAALGLWRQFHRKKDPDE
ncbi:hypothetical protein KIM372_17860 [Bombiscardovia nodaiensis]|uniref:Uncharacterized protein n=1 Tax=Bombiscardovia nodaiensis TaxID=2932181 RepID=A0ABM8BAN4_9BIFI|nr:hypothetical protein KIM372_17860 [Bombiscardovia nodaiensis]